MRILLSALSMVLLSTMSEAAPKKKFVYRSHTQIDLTGETVQGKVRSPEVFYIFQRKRSEQHSVVRAPETLVHHDEWAKKVLMEGLSQ